MAALAASVVLAGLTYWLSPQRTYDTGIGEQRSFKLADGSLIHLNTASRAEVHYTSEAREVRLVTGEAMFIVERDPKRPFRVLAGETTIQAVGTQFNVYRRGNSVTVAVVEGRVRVEKTPVAAGEEVSVAKNGSVTKRAAADVADAVSWRQRRLVFREDTLADVAAEFNRYNTLQIRVEGDAVREKHLNGVFNADHPEGLALFLRKDPALTVTAQGDALVIRARE